VLLLKFEERAALDKLRPKQFEQKHEPGSRAYIPAFGHSFLTPFYDLMMKWAAREAVFKPKLVEQARIKKGDRVLDLGCGTATLTILIKKTQPQAEVRGLDTDPKILEIAKSKAAQAGVDIGLDYGTAMELPYSENSFDHVFSSMVLHHLSREDKVRALGEVCRVLKPGGELHVADFGRPQNTLMHLPSLAIRRFEETSDLVKGLLPEMLQDVGFECVEQTTRYMTIFGTFTLYKAQKPWESSSKKAGNPRTDKNLAVKNGNREIMAEEKEYYDLIRKGFHILAPFYDAGTAFMSRLRGTVVDFTNARTGSRILDVATGTGKQAFAFAKKGYDIIGIDLSKDMLKVAQKKNRYENVRFEHADAADLPFEDRSFDVSCVSFALHDMIPTIREKALKEMVRVTRPRGTIVIVDYAVPKNRVWRFLIYHFVKLYERYYPEFMKSDLETLLRKSGIEIKEELPVLLGAGRVLKGKRMSHSFHDAQST